MREIKFKRYYDNGQPPVVMTLDDIENEIKDDEWQPYAFQEQYTGIKDKNGVEIYEGDIVRIRWTKVGEPQYTEKLIEDIRKNVFGFFFDNIGNMDSKDLEVIGNILALQDNK